MPARPAVVRTSGKGGDGLGDRGVAGEQLHHGAVLRVVDQVGGPGSHLVAHLARANCLVVVPEDVTGLPAGAEVGVVLIEGALQ